MSKPVYYHDLPTLTKSEQFAKLLKISSDALASLKYRSENPHGQTPAEHETAKKLYAKYAGTQVAPPVGQASSSPSSPSAFRVRDAVRLKWGVPTYAGQRVGRVVAINPNKTLQVVLKSGLKVHLKPDYLETIKPDPKDPHQYIPEDTFQHEEHRKMHGY